MSCAAPPAGSALPEWLREEQRPQPPVGALIWSRSDLHWQPPRALACLLKPIGLWVSADDPRLAADQSRETP